MIEGEELSTGVKIFFGIVAIIEVYYWFVWMPKAWRVGKTRELRELKYFVKEMGKFYRNGM